MMGAIHRVTILLALLAAAAAVVSHTEYLRFEDTDLDLQGVVADVTSKSDCECRKSCHLTLSCSKLSRFQDAACFTEKPDSAYRQIRSMEVTKGPDGLYYTVPDAKKLNKMECKSLCISLPGFRLPIIRTLATKKLLQSWVATWQVWLDLHRQASTIVGRLPDDGYRWSDGTILDRTTLDLRDDEPWENDANSPEFVMWTNRKIDNHVATGKFHCSCQANLDNIENY